MAKIILLHGLHMHSWVMKPLAYLLEQEGFEAGRREPVLCGELQCVALDESAC